jgi:hypothetical protein
MAFKTAANAALGIPGAYGLTPGVPDTAPGVAIGTIAKFYDDVQGEGEFIYLPGAANVAAGDIVIYDVLAGTVTRHSNATGTNSGRQVAFAIQALPANTYGWYQIEGLAIVSVVAGTVAGSMMGTATAGSVGNTADAGDQILNARIVSAAGTPLANKAYAQINRPFVQGQIT